MPIAYASRWSSQLPSRSQTWQSSGWFIKKQLDDVAAGLAEVFGVSMYLHTVKDRISTGCEVIFKSFDFKLCKPCTHLLWKVSVVTQSRIAIAAAVRRLHNCLVLVNTVWFAIDCYRYLSSIEYYPYFFVMASNLHLVKQTPHLMHLFWSIVCFAFTVPAYKR